MLRRLHWVRALSVAALVVVSCLALSAMAQTAVAPAALGAKTPMIGPGKIFTFFLVMLGPIKLLGPFAKLTADLDVVAARRLAFRGVAIACLGGAAAASLGQTVLHNWGVALPALLLAVGLVLLLVALQNILAQYGAPTPEGHDEGKRRGLALSPLAFPYIVTPYGIAALILLMAASGPERDALIFSIFLAVMALNLVFMWFARPILKYLDGVLQILGAVFGVLQVALALQFILSAGYLLGLMPPLVAA